MREVAPEYAPTEIQIRNLQRYADCTAWQAAQALSLVRGQWEAAVQRVHEMITPPVRRRARRRK